MTQKKECSTCKGTGIVKIHWNEKVIAIDRTWPRYYNRYKEEWCKRCDGNGTINIKWEAENDWIYFRVTYRCITRYILETQPERQTIQKEGGKIIMTENKCTTCQGTGIVRMKYNDRWLRSNTEWYFFKDEWCKKCEGKGVVTTLGEQTIQE